MRPLVSVITPTFNSEDFILETVRSVQNQTFQNWELIVIDDASSDRTVELVQTIQDDRIQLIQLDVNSGAAVARNRGIDLAKGRYIAFLDADDLWLPSKLGKQLQFMTEKDASVSYGSYDLMDETGAALGKRILALPRLSYQKLLRSNYIGNLTGMYDTQKLGKVYAPLLRKRQDWGLWLSCLENSDDAYGIKESLAKYRVRKGSISSNKLEMIKHNFAMYRKARNFSWAKSLWYLVGFLLEHFFVKSRQIVPISSTKDLA